MSPALSISSTLQLIHSGVKVPQLGFGVYRSSQDQCKASTLAALRAGYRHIDSAQFYRNEREVGEAVRESGIPRNEIFVTTKVMAPGGNPSDTYKKCLHSVEIIDPGEDGYVDLFLIHSAKSGAAKIQEMWQALEKLLGEGKVRSIGVSNFSADHIEGMKSYAVVWPPPINQIELHPWCQQGPTVDYCEKNSIILQAYSPLTRMKYTHNETLVTIAKSKSKAPAQVLIRWSLQKGYIPLPKSDNPERIEANASVFDFELSGEEMRSLDQMDPDRTSLGAIVEKVA